MEHGEIPEPGETVMLEGMGTFQVIQKKKYMYPVLLSFDAGVVFWVFGI